MAERVAPPPDKPPIDDDPPPPHVLPPPPPPPIPTPPTNVPTAFLPLGTYVVQVPKEQIYRFPTAENAKVAEKYRNPPPRQHPGLAFLARFCGFLLFVAIILGLIAALIYFIVDPQPPKFTVDSVNVRKQSHHKHHRRQFHVRLTSQNTRPRMGISYLEGGSAALLYKLEEIASGEPQAISSSKHTTVFKLSLSNSQALLPQKIRKSMEGRGPRGGLPLSLSVVIPVKLKVTGVSLWSTKVVVDCHLKVRGLREKTNVLSQSCKVRFS